MFPSSKTIKVLGCRPHETEFCLENTNQADKENPLTFIAHMYG